MSEEWSNFDLVPDLKEVRKIIKAAIADGYDPKSIALSKPRPLQDTLIVASKGGIAMKWFIHYTWSRVDSARYERDARYCDGDAMTEYARAFAAKLAKKGKVTSK